MEFVDETRIRVRSGRGGDGCVAFRRERNLPLGGPSGGDGGIGGSILLRANPNADTLLPLARTQSYAARDGEPGRGAFRHGKNAENVVIPVPVGTRVRDETGVAVADLDAPGREVVLVRGGLGGRGNAGHKSATHQSPREFTYGGDGVDLVFRLELRLIADVGLLGFPNAGKSTLLARLSAARPRIADYPFTTLQPQLGIVSDGDGQRELVLADIPGIIEGAADGAGMGLAFLRHVERCRFLLHLVDLCPFDGTYPWDSVRVIEKELARHSPVLASRPRFLVGNKIDLPGAQEALELLSAEMGEPVMGISAATGLGLEAFRRELFRRLGACPRPEVSPLAAVTDLDGGRNRLGARGVRADPRRGGAPEAALVFGDDDGENEEPSFADERFDEAAGKRNAPKDDPFDDDGPDDDGADRPADFYEHWK